MTISLRKCFNCASRRGLDVPTTAHTGKLLIETLSSSMSRLSTRASLGSSRSQIAAIVSSSGRIVGTSFSEWTAMSMRPSSSASSSSFVKTPFPPITESGSVFKSPEVLMISMLTSTAGPANASFALTHSACVSASLEPREPMTKLSLIFDCDRNYSSRPKTSRHACMVSESLVS